MGKKQKGRNIHKNGGSLMQRAKNLRANSTKKAQNNARRKQKEEAQRQKKKKAKMLRAKAPYSYVHDILLVGEGDFSFAAALSAQLRQQRETAEKIKKEEKQIDHNNNNNNNNNNNAVKKLGIDMSTSVDSKLGGLGPEESERKERGATKYFFKQNRIKEKTCDVEREHEDLKDETKTRVIAVVMTKDRAFQLQECLRSLQHCCSDFNKVYVMCNAVGRFQKSYDTVKEKFPDVSFIYDKDRGEFAKNLQCLVERHTNDLICFIVDDMVFYRKFTLQHAVQLLKDDTVLGYHLGLHPGVRYCHPSDKEAIVPADIRAFGRIGKKSGPKENCSKVGSIVFRRVLGTQDWNYPWNLCGGIYRGSDTKDIVSSVVQEFDLSGIGHPNHLEVNGNKVILALRLDHKRPFSACPDQPISSVVTINRVQDVYRNRIYEPKIIKKSAPSDPSTTDTRTPAIKQHLPCGNTEAGDIFSLDKLLWQGARLDLSRYRDLDPDSVHIGLLAITAQAD